MDPILFKESLAASLIEGWVSERQAESLGTI